MRKRIVSLCIVMVMMLASCGKKDVPTNNLESAQNPSDTSIEEAQDEPTNTPEEKEVDVTEDVTPTPVEIVEDGNPNESIGLLSCIINRRDDFINSGFMIKDSGNMLTFTFVPNVSGEGDIKVYDDGNSLIEFGVSSFEAGRLYTASEMMVSPSDYRIINAYVEIEGVRSNTFKIYTYDKYTEENAKEVRQSMENMEALNDDLLVDGYISPDNVSEALSRIETAAKKLLDDGHALVVNKGESSIYIKFSNGIEYVYSPSLEGVKSSGKELSIYTYQPFEDADINTLPSEPMEKAAKYVDDAFDHIEYSHDINNDAINIESIVGRFGRNQIIIWDGHGGYHEEVGSYILTGEQWYGRATDGPLIGKGWIVTTEGYFGVGAGFFDHFFGPTSLDNSFIILNACYTGTDKDNYALMKMLESKGARVVTAFSDIVKVKYSNNIVSYMLEKMCQIDDETGDYFTAYDAICCAVTVYGADDADDTPAAPRFLGDKSYSFSNALEDFVECPIPDGRYDLIMGDNTQNPVFTHPDTNSMFGNMHSATVNVEENVLILETGFIDSDLRIFDYGTYELPLSDDVVVGFWAYDSESEDGSAAFWEIDDMRDLNGLFTPEADEAGSIWSFGCAITIEDGVVTKLEWWGD